MYLLLHHKIAQMTIKISKNTINILTESNTTCQVTVATFLGTTVFDDTITPQNNQILIQGLNPGKYTIKISNKLQLFKQQININNN